MTTQKMENIADKVLDVNFINHDFSPSIPGLPQGVESLKQCSVHSLTLNNTLEILKGENNHA